MPSAPTTRVAVTAQYRLARRSRRRTVRRSGLRGLGCRLRGLLGGAHLGERLGIHDVRDRAVTAGLGVVAGGLLPALGVETALLAEKGEEDACLLVAEARQRLQAFQHLGAVGVALAPDRCGVAVPVVDDGAAERLRAGSHG